MDRARLAMRGLCLLMLLMTATLAAAQEMMPAQPQRPGGKKPEPQYAFDNTDQLVGTIGRMRQEYFVGEPIVIPVILTNHTRFPLKVETNFNPRSCLKVTVHPINLPARRYTGPYFAGEYQPNQYKMEPFTDVRQKVLIWGDLNAPTGLAFPEPNDYILDLALEVTVVGQKVAGTIQLGRIPIKITPVPEQYQKIVPLIEKIKQDKAAVYMHLRKNVPGWGPHTEELIKQFPPSVFTPYLYMSLAEYYTLDFARDRTNKKAADGALKAYQIAAMSDSPFQFEALSQLLELCDTLELNQFAEQTAQKILDKATPDMLGLIGDAKLIAKYLINTEELKRDKYWAVLP